MIDFKSARTMMVDTQVRPSDVTKFPIIDAMLSVPRETYVPDQMQSVAYVGEHLDFGTGRTLLDPRSFAKLLDALEFQGNEMVLDIGSLLGYSSAVIARMCDAVVAVEDDGTMIADAEAIWSGEGVDNVIAVQVELADGAKEHGPYDVIILEGAVESIPMALLEQLKDGGRIAAIFQENASGEARIGIKSGAVVTWRLAFNCAAPVLPGFEKAPEFTL